MLNPKLKALLTQSGAYAAYNIDEASPLLEDLPIIRFAKLLVLEAASIADQNAPFDSSNAILTEYL